MECHSHSFLITSLLPLSDDDEDQFGFLVSFAFTTLQHSHYPSAKQRKQLDASGSGNERLSETRLSDLETSVFFDLKILKLQGLFHLKLLIFVYESIHKISPVCFHNFFETLASVH